MKLAVLGALAGFAQGLGSRVEKEREENEELVKTRLQLAAVNKKKREEEVRAIKEDLSGRYSEVMPWLEPTTDEAVKLALISSPEIAKQFAQRRRDGEAIDAATFVREKADEIRKKAPKGFETVRKYIDSFGAAPTAMTEEQMQQAFGQKEGFMGFNVGTKPGRAEKIASGLGVGSARELLAYENMQPLSREPLADLATINTEMYGKRFDSVEEAAKQAEMDAFNAEQRFGADDPRTTKAAELAASLAERVEAPVKSLESRAQTLASQIFDEQDPQKKAAMEERLKSIYSAISAHKSAVEGDKEKSVATIDSSVRRYVNTRMQESLGASWMKYTRPKEIQLPDGSTYTMLDRKEDMPVEEQQKMFADQRRFARQALVENGYIGPDGQPLYNSVREVMTNLGIRGSMPQTAAASSNAAAAPARAPQAASAQPAQTEGPVTVQLPDGRKASFPNQKAADEFKKATGIK